jgi:hypothetical protein
MNFSPERLPNRNTIAQIKNKKMNKEFSAGTGDENSTKDDGLHVSPACIKPNVIGGFVVGQRVVWDSHFGYEIGYFLGEGLMMNTYLIDVCTGKITGNCSYSQNEVHKYSDELIDSLTKKYGYEKRF